MTTQSLKINDNCLTHALSYLSDPKDLCRASSVCKQWNVAADQDLLWNKLPIALPLIAKFNNMRLPLGNPKHPVKNQVVYILSRNCKSTPEIVNKIEQFLNKISFGKRGTFLCITRPNAYGIKITIDKSHSIPQFLQTAPIIETYTGVPEGPETPQERITLTRKERNEIASVEYICLGLTREQTEALDDIRPKVINHYYDAISTKEDIDILFFVIRCLCITPIIISLTAPYRSWVRPFAVANLTPGMAVFISQDDCFMDLIPIPSKVRHFASALIPAATIYLLSSPLLNDSEKGALYHCSDLTHWSLTIMNIVDNDNNVQSHYKFAMKTLFTLSFFYLSFQAFLEKRSVA